MAQARPSRPQKVQPRNIKTCQVDGNNLLDSMLCFLGCSAPWQENNNNEPSDHHFSTDRQDGITVLAA
ncbi:hypothetical protein FJTKL_11194 [Diaporthe vaccinii]|uniref:Uncharacterized protein n=1 Tax=Diaporthe vaccinii TaxID=105482 RepID=A0ABR4EIA3_9PEZI